MPAPQAEGPRHNPLQLLTEPPTHPNRLAQNTSGTGILARVFLRSYTFKYVHSCVALLADTASLFEEPVINGQIGGQGRASGSAIDFLICAVAMERGWQIFTSDDDFRLYGEAVPLPLYTSRASL